MQEWMKNHLIFVSYHFTSPISCDGEGASTRFIIMLPREHSFLCVVSFFFFSFNLPHPVSWFQRIFSLQHSTDERLPIFMFVLPSNANKQCWMPMIDAEYIVHISKGSGKSNSLYGDNVCLENIFARNIWWYAARHAFVQLFCSL